METKQDLTILVVDNDPVGAKVLERTMHREVYQVITADVGPPPSAKACFLTGNIHG